MEELYRQLYAKYSPGLSEEELNTKLQFASDQDPEEWVNAFYQKYTGSGPSEEQSKYISNYISENDSFLGKVDNVVEDALGFIDDTIDKIPGLGGVFGDLYKKTKIGFDIGTDTSEIYDALSPDKAEDISDEKLQKIIDLNANRGQTDADIAYQKIFDANVEKHGRAGAWLRGVADSKGEWLLQQGFQSLGMMGGAAVDNPLAVAGGGAAGYGVSKVANKFINKLPDKGKAGTLKKILKMGFGGYATIKGMYGGTTYALEKATTMQETINEELQQDGLEVNPENIKKLLSDPEKYRKIKNDATKRGLAIGVVDFFTAGYGIGANKAIIRAGGKKITGAAGAAGVEVVGGFASEIAGQAAGDQEFKADEILSEGFNLGPSQIQSAYSNIVKPTSYSINGGKMNYNKFTKELDQLDDETLALADIDIKNDDVLSSIVRERQSDGKIKNELLDTSVTDQADRDTLFDLEKNRLDLQNKAKSNSSQTLKNEISSNDKKIKDITNKYFEVDSTLKQNKLDQQAMNLGRGSRQTLEGDIIKGKAILGDDFKYTETQQDFDDLVDKDFADASDDFKAQMKQSAGSEIDGKVYINKAKAISNGKINVVAHEILHKALGKHMATDKGKAAALNFYNKLSANDRAQVDRAISGARYSQAYMQANPDEYITQYLDLVESKTSSVQMKEGAMTAINDYLAEFLKAIGLKAEFETAGDVRRFLKDYRKNFKSGKLKLNDPKVSSRKFSKVNLDQDADPGPIVDALTKGAKTKAEFQSANGGFGQVYEAIIDGDFDKLFGSGLNKQQKDLAREELANRLVNYDPAKTPSLYKWFGSNIVYAKREANKALAIEAKKDRQTKSIDQAKKNAEGDSFATQIEDTQELTADEVLDLKLAEEREAKQAPVKVKETLRRKMGFERDGKVHNRIKKAIKTNILRKMMVTRSALKEDIATGQYKKGDKITEAVDITDLRWQKELNKNLGFDLQETMYEVMGRSTVDYTNFLDKFIVEAFDMMDQNLINKRYKDLVVKVIDRQGSKQSSLDKNVKSKTAGNAKFEKANKTKEELIDYFLKRGRKESLAQVLGIEFGHDATMEVLAEPEIMSKAEEVLVNKGNFKNQALRSIIGKQVNRDPNAKFSKVDGNEVISKLNKDNLNVTKSNLRNVIKFLLPNEDKAEIKRITNSLYTPIKTYVEKVIEKVEAVNIDVNAFVDAALKMKKDAEAEGRDIFLLTTGKRANANSKFEFGGKPAVDARDNVVKYHDSKFSENMTFKEKVQAVRELSLHRRNQTSAGLDKQRAQKYYQVFLGKEDYNSTVWEPLKQYGVEIIGSKYFVDGKVIEVPIAPSTITKDGKTKTFKQKTIENYEAGKTYSDLAFTESQNMIKWYVKNATGEQQAMAFITMKQDMQGVFKSAAPVEFYFEGKHKGPLRWEHMLATQKALVLSILHHQGKGTVTLKQIKDKYKVAIIPEAMDNNINIQFRQDSIADIIKDPIDKRYYNEATWGYPNMFAIKSLDTSKPEVLGQGWVLTDAQASKIATPEERALMMAKDNVIAKFSKVEKGMSIFDFDDTLAQSNSKVGVTMPDGKKRKITATEFAVESADLEAAGATFEFSEFNKVIDGKKGPFFDLAQQINSKFGNKDIYVLTARPQEAAYAIHAFLKGMGLNIPIENITGLEDGKASAKANWVVNKINSGYNNILFADDAIKNVQAVKEVLEAANVKNDVKLAQVKFSKTLDENFNTILERKSGINKNEEYSRAAGKAAGLGKGKYKFWMPPSAEDFVGLMYNMLPEGKAGEKSFKFFTQALIDPYWAGVRSLNAAKQALGNDFYALKKRFPKAFRSLLKDVGYKQYSNEQAIRVYLWNKAGFEIPGMSKVDIEKLSDIVRNNHNMRGFADLVGATTKLEEGYIKPGQDWVSGTIAYDYFSIAQKTNRKKYLANWIERKNEIFSEKNMNKIEAIYGEDYRSALEDILWRMENGTNRTTGKNKLVNSWMNWVNNSVGAIMFFNSRSAILQTISMINFINWSDNNPLKAGMAFANQKQFWSDFSMIFNSDMLKQRRSGLQSDVNEAEIAQAVAGKTDKASAAISYLLKKGFLPTQMADSFAISMGGASFYRNRFNTYVEQGMTEAQAKDKAFADFAKTSEESQQSADPALISQQQAGPLGRLILAFQNTPMQYARLIKKAVLDLKNGRGDVKTNISKILYYGVLQNIIFSTLQSGLFALAFDDEEDEELTQKLENKKLRALNTSLDSLLRGGGVYGAGISTIKNMILQFNAQNDKGYRADHAYTMIEAINLSPPIGSKVRKIYSATQTYKFNKKIIPTMGMGIDNPAYLAIANIVSASTNIPLDRAIMKLNNLRASADSQNQAWQRVATFLGWNTWDVGVKNKAVEKAKAKSKRKGKSKSNKDIQRLLNKRK